MQKLLSLLSLLIFLSAASGCKAKPKLEPVLPNPPFCRGGKTCEQKTEKYKKKLKEWKEWDGWKERS